MWEMDLERRVTRVGGKYGKLGVTLMSIYQTHTHTHMKLSKEQKKDRMCKRHFSAGRGRDAYNLSVQDGRGERIIEILVCLNVRVGVVWFVEMAR